MSFLTAGVLYMMLNWLPTLIHARGFTVAYGQMTPLAFNIASVAGPLVMGSLIDRYGYKYVLPLCYLGFLMGIVGLAFTSGLSALLLSVAVVGLFLMGAQFSLNGVASTFYPPAVRGLGIGSALAVGRVGSILGPLAAGYIIQAGGGTAGVLTAMIPVVAISAATMVLLTWSGRKPVRIAGRRCRRSHFRRSPAGKLTNIS